MSAGASSRSPPIRPRCSRWPAPSGPGDPLARGRVTLAAPAMRSPQADARDRLTAGLFLLNIALLFADQNLMAPSLSLIGQEFGFSRADIDRRLGADINLTFWMLGGVVTLLIG